MKILKDRLYILLSVDSAFILITFLSIIALNTQTSVHIITCPQDRVTYKQVTRPFILQGVCLPRGRGELYGLICVEVTLAAPMHFQA